MEKYTKALNEFKSLPKPNLDPTFMDICHMGGDRFEERCSQILRFYFEPNGCHKLRDLLLKSLLEEVSKHNIACDDLVYTYNSTKVITEEVTSDNKRIDITIDARNFVIAIENKIFADLYNPLESYTVYINSTYKEKRKIYVVLSVREITGKEELEKIKDNGYIYINYKDFFSTVKKNMGFYSVDCNQTYLTFLLDFIKTIEKKYDNSNMEELKKFIFSNYSTVKELHDAFDNVINEINNNKYQYLSDIRNEMMVITGNNSWWTGPYQGWLWGIAFKNDQIKIVYWLDNEDCPHTLGAFKYGLQIQREYLQLCLGNERGIRILSELGINTKDIKGNGLVSIDLETIFADDKSQIINRLKSTYDLIKELTQYA